jgi:hypothetical protein
MKIQKDGPPPDDDDDDDDDDDKRVNGKTFPLISSTVK